MNTFIIMLSLVFSTNAKTDVDQINLVLHEFVKYVDEQNIEKTSSLLDENFRSVLNRAFDTEKVDVLEKKAYLDLMGKKVIGGDERSVEICSIELSGNNASVKAKLVGKKLIFETFIQFVKNKEGIWMVISELPMIQVVG